MTGANSRVSVCSGERLGMQGYDDAQSQMLQDGQKSAVDRRGYTHSLLYVIVGCSLRSSSKFARSLFSFDGDWHRQGPLMPLNLGHKLTSLSSTLIFIGIYIPILMFLYLYIRIFVYSYIRISIVDIIHTKTLTVDIP